MLDDVFLVGPVAPSVPFSTTSGALSASMISSEGLVTVTVTLFGSMPSLEMTMVVEPLATPVTAPVFSSTVAISVLEEVYLTPSSVQLMFAVSPIVTVSLSAPSGRAIFCFSGAGLEAMVVAALA